MIDGDPYPVLIDCGEVDAVAGDEEEGRQEKEEGGTKGEGVTG